jgi:hypothetical protein
MAVTFIAGFSISNSPDQSVYAEPETKVEVVVVEKVIEKIDTPESYILEVFGHEQGTRAIYMLKECENRTLKTDAINYNGNGSNDFGLFQINSIHGYTHAQLADYKFNTDVAYKLYKNAGYQFTPWTCAWVINETPFYLK